MCQYRWFARGRGWVLERLRVKLLRAAVHSHESFYALPHSRQRSRAGGRRSQHRRAPGYVAREREQEVISISLPAAHESMHPSRRVSLLARCAQLAPLSSSLARFTYLPSRRRVLAVTLDRPIFVAMDRPPIGARNPVATIRATNRWIPGRLASRGSMTDRFCHHVHL